MTNIGFQTSREENTTTTATTAYHQKHCESLSISNNSSEFDTSSSEDRGFNDVMDGDSVMRKRKGSGRGWKAKIKEFIDAQMRKLMEKQEEWMERLMRTLEQKERERTARDEEWRKSEVDRVEREHKFWAKERAWIEARDKALMEALHKMTGSSSTTTDNNNNNNNINNNNNNNDGQENRGEDTKELVVSKKRKENANSRCYFGNNNESSSSLYSGGGGAYCAEMSNEHGGNEGSDCGNNANVVGNENCFPFLMGEGENLWENYGMKLKGSQNQ